MNRVLDNTQKMLDKQKWEESEKQRYDMGGCMLYCQYCDKADHSHATENGKCYATPEEREKYSLCAKAYKRMIAKNREKAWLSKNV
jgi:hypothetical protein